MTPDQQFDNTSKPQERRNRLILVGVAILVIMFIVIRTWDALFPFVLSAVIAYLVWPMVKLFEKWMPARWKKRNIARILSILIVYLILIAILVLALYLFFSVVILELARLIDAIPTLSAGVVDQINNWLTHGNVPSLLQSYQERIEPAIRLQIETQLQTVGQRILEGMLGVFQQGIKGVAESISRTVGFLLGILVIPIWLFYVLSDAEVIQRSLFHLIPYSFRDEISSILRIMDRIFNDFLRGQLVLCLIIGLLSVFGLTVIGVQYALILGIIAAVTEAIPMIGPLLGMIPALLIALSQGPSTFFYALILYMVIAQVEAMYLKPRIMGDSLALHPAVIMVVLLMGAALGGILGMILSAPITAIFRELFKYVYLRLSEDVHTPHNAMERLIDEDLNLDEI